MLRFFQLFFFLLCAPFFLIAVEHDTIAANSKISLVTVYLNGAEITRSATLQLPKGRSVISISEVSTYLSDKTIQGAFSKKNIRILSINITNNVSNAQKEEKAETLKDQIALLDEKMDRLELAIKNYDHESDLITKNKARIGKEGGTDVVELSNAADFFRKRLNEIAIKKYKVKAEKKTLLTEKNELADRLRKINQERRKASKSIELIVDSPVAQSSGLEVNYIVQRAAWTPKYNIRSESIEEPITFEYLAKIHNGSGVDWSQVNLVLSTGDPFKSINKPNLKAWTLKFITDEYNRRSKYKKEYSKDSFSEGELDDKVALFNSTVTRGTNKAPAATNVEVSEVAVDFKIPVKYTVKGDGKEQLVEVTTHELPASYLYYTVPKLDKDAFLIAHVTDWEKVNIIDAPANIYYKGKYVGESYIDTRYANDTLDISMGRDSKINISRVKIKDFNKKSLIGLNKKEAFKYEISIRNTYSKPIQIEVIDQVPISLENEIDVSVNNISKAEQDTESGRLKWSLEIPPGTTQKLTTEFVIKYPRNKIINSKRTRKIYSPRFY